TARRRERQIYGQRAARDVAMPLVSVTRLRLRKARYVPAFMLWSLRSKWQAERSPGFLGGILLADRERTYWTISVWRDEAAMREYRSSGAHARAMRRLPRWCDEAAAGHWEQPGSERPSANDAHARLAALGAGARFTPVEHPSPRHVAREVGPPPVREQGIPMKPKA
ncbi:MAG TPA: DUF3291 domain-containing protein, partial [Candidatus Thermoplasmatota archaeon]|nr:DUF3291 domain-containing protein [Candidatus Thermoplasmatota archaeon]